MNCSSQFPVKNFDHSDGARLSLDFQLAARIDQTLEQWKIGPSKAKKGVFMKLMTAILCLLAAPAFAHIEKGNHEGKTAAGETCTLTAGDQTFVNGQHHPLNERIEIQVGADKFVVGHPPVIDAAAGTAFFNHDQFQGILATSTGATALVIEMIHTEEKEGPESYTLITHNWRANQATKVVCSGLTFKN
jgi:hypothetical protein